MAPLLPHGSTFPSGSASALSPWRAFCLPYCGTHKCTGQTGGKKRKGKTRERVEADPYLPSDVLLTPSVDAPLIPPPTLLLSPLSLSSSPPKSLPSPCCVPSPPRRCLSEAPFQLPHNNSGLPHTLSLSPLLFVPPRPFPLSPLLASCVHPHLPTHHY